MDPQTEEVVSRGTKRGRGRALVSLLAMATAASACDGDPIGPAAVEIRTDQPEYSLVGRSLEVVVTLTNTGTRAVYLNRTCGDGDQPSAVLRRPDGYDVPIAFGGIACEDRPRELLAPFEIAAGESFIDEVDFDADRREDVREWTGTFRIEYRVQFTDRLSREGVDLIAEDERISNTFNILRPALP